MAGTPQGHPLGAFRAVSSAALPPPSANSPPRDPSAAGDALHGRCRCATVRVCVCVCAHVCARVYPRGSRRYVCTCVRAAPGAPRGPTALPSLRRGCTGTGDPAGVGGRGGSSGGAARCGQRRGGTGEAAGTEEEGAQLGAGREPGERRGRQVRDVEGGGQPESGKAARGVSRAPGVGREGGTTRRGNAG